MISESDGGSVRNIKTPRSTFICVVLFLSVMATSASVAALPDLSGKWRMNCERSEDAKKKLEEALATSGIPNHRVSSVGPNRDARALEREQTRRRIEALIEASETLEIKVDKKQVTVLEGNLRERRFYTDGRPYQREDKRGNRIVVRSRWRGEQLVVNTTLADGNRFSESYELAPGGRQLIVTFRSVDRRLKQPLVISRVYDAVPNDQQQPASQVHSCRRVHRRWGYGTSDFVSNLATEVERGSIFNAPRETQLRSLLQERDDAITTLARSDPYSADRLTKLYDQYRQAITNVAER